VTTQALTLSNHSNKAGIRWLCWFLFAVGVARLCFVVAHDPVFGYANQYDALRTSSCVGIWPVLPDAKHLEAHATAPIEHYRQGETITRECFWSTDVVLAKSAWEIASLFKRFGADTQAISIRLIAALKAIILVSCSFLALRSIAADWLRVAYAASFAFVLADPISTLYLTSLYTEGGALLGFWIMFSGFAVLVSQSVVHATLERPRGLTLIYFGALCLGCSRVPHAVFPALVLAFVQMLGRQCLGSRVREFAVVMCTISAVSVAVAFTNYQHIPIMQKVNRWDALFGTFIPAHPEPIKALAALQLPEACKSLEGTNWYFRRGRDADNQCPEAFALTTPKLVYHWLTTPSTLITTVARAIHFDHWHMPHVGQVEGRIYQTANTVSAIATGLQQLRSGMTWSQRALFWALPVIAFLGLGVLRLLPAQTSLARTELLKVITLLCIVSTVTFASSLMGDGYIEFGRHAHLGVLASLTAWIVIASYCLKERDKAGVITIMLALILSWATVSAARYIPQTYAFSTHEPNHRDEITLEIIDAAGLKRLSVVRQNQSEDLRFDELEVEDPKHFLNMQKVYIVRYPSIWLNTDIPFELTAENSLGVKTVVDRFYGIQRGEKRR
jgi:hypothetical protein